MEKLFWFCRRKEEPSSPASDLPRGVGLSLQRKCSKKLHKAASAGDSEKLKQYLQLKKYDVNMQDKDHR